MNKIEWRPMRCSDLDQVMALSEAAHPTLPESLETQDKRLRLYPQGCLVLAGGPTILGYAFSHPIRHAAPPALNRAPDRLSADLDELYLHDFVISAALRGQGYASQGVSILLARAADFASLGLISVYGTAVFWNRFGFEPCQDVPPEKLRTYGAGAIYMTRSAGTAATLRESCDNTPTIR